MSELVANIYGYGFHTKSRSRLSANGDDGEMMKMSGAIPEESVQMAECEADSMKSESAKEKKDIAAAPPAPGGKAARNGGSGGEDKSPAKPDLSKVAARSNLNETAFFFPQLTTDAEGSVKMTFTMPEALTKWHFMGYAHGKNLENAMIEEHAVTQKDLMVQPNPPRFLREGDILEFSVKVTNMVDKDIKGSVRFTLLDPVSEKPLDELFLNQTTDQAVEIPAKQSKSFHWRITDFSRNRFTGA